jgi:hypothetical protein
MPTTNPMSFQRFQQRVEELFPGATNFTRYPGEHVSYSARITVNDKPLTLHMSYPDRDGPGVNLYTLPYRSSADVINRPDAEAQLTAAAERLRANQT